ncbi:CSTN2 protein, partial [Polyodon spathula]|nr:CSTN2 protein [Polyodon spathula]
QICDKEWHYYVINVEFPVVTLYVDGVTYEPYLVTDDWPIHPSQIDMQLTVGACWQGGEVIKPQFTQYFRGSLAGLTIHPGKIESQKVISCLQACKEGLDINSLESLGQRIKFHFNPSQSTLVMEGDDIEYISQALRKVSYINSRQFPTPGIRRLKTSTTVQCYSEDTCISIPDVDAFVVVLQPSEPQIIITGMDHFARPDTEFESSEGLVLFPDVRIISTVAKTDPLPQGKAHKHGGQEEIIHNLDYCDILVIGNELNPDQEILQLNKNELHGKHLDATNSTSGISIYGVDTMSNYEQVLRQVRYLNWHSGGIFGRRFRLTCSELNGRYTSNEFNLEATIPSIATIVIAVCISSLLLIVVLGIYRIRVARLRSCESGGGAKENQMDWDDSALTITINPMEIHSLTNDTSTVGFLSRKCDSKFNGSQVEANAATRERKNRLDKAPNDNRYLNDFSKVKEGIKDIPLQQRLPTLVLASPDPAAFIGVFTFSMAKGLELMDQPVLPPQRISTHNGCDAGSTVRSPQRISMTTVWIGPSRVHLWGHQVGTFCPLFCRLAHDTSRGLNSDSGVPAAPLSIPHSTQPSLLAHTSALLSFY